MTAITRRQPGTRRLNMGLGLILLLLYSAITTADGSLPQPFTATYEARYGSLSVDASRSLTLGPDQQLEFRFEAKHWLANIEEFSQLRWDEQRQQLQPLYYSYLRRGLGRERQAQLTFDHQAGQVTNDVQNKPWTMPVPGDVLDKLSYQLQLRADLINQRPQMEYQVADGGHLKTYRFAMQGEEILHTPLGALNTVKVQRLREDSDRVTLLWLARDWDYLIVRIQQTEDDGKYYEINLTSAELNGQPVTGL